MKEFELDYDYIDLSYAKAGNLIFDVADVFIPVYEIFFIKGGSMKFLEEKFLGFSFIRFNSVSSIVLSKANGFYEKDIKKLVKRNLARMNCSDLERKVSLMEHILSAKYMRRIVI